jgi:hypothetical protein
MKYPVSLAVALIVYCGASAQRFTLAVYPDTQIEVRANNKMFFDRFDWIVQKRDSLNIPMVLGVGDLVDFDNYNHWEIASKGYEAFDLLKIPYSISLGNHDTEAVGTYTGSAAPGNTNQNLRKTAKFNSYFPQHRFANLRGVYEPGKSDNAYYTFKVGDTNWLVITLEFCPRLGPINWASDLCKEFFDYNVIITTHYYLTPRGEIAETNAGYGDFAPWMIFSRLVKPNPNVRLVLSGHVPNSAWRVDEIEGGNKVYSILQNYQNEDSGGGYIRLLTIDVDKGTIEASMYSPYYNKTKEDKSKFVIEGVSFINNKKIQDEGIRLEQERQRKIREEKAQQEAQNKNQPPAGNSNSKSKSK